MVRCDFADDNLAEKQKGKAEYMQNTYAAFEAASLLVFKSMHDESITSLEHHATLIAHVIALHSSYWVSHQRPFL